MRQVRISQRKICISPSLKIEREVARNLTDFAFRSGKIHNLSDIINSERWAVGDTRYKARQNHITIKNYRKVKNMILVNIDYISGKKLETLGLVKGSTIQSKHIGKDITQSFKTLVGGELKAYNEMMNEARDLATKRMVEEAQSLGADAVINVRYASAAVMQGAAEVIVYGTAVKFIEE